MQAFCRFQEHYESPNKTFSERPFTLGEFRDWYRERYGKWSYYNDWSGTNVPAHIFKAFQLGRFDPLSKEEQNLLNKLPKSGDYYVIGTSGTKQDMWAINHEIAHGLFYINKTYRDTSTKLIKKYSRQLAKLFKKLGEIGYSKSVYIDEAQAYISTDDGWLKSNDIQIPVKLSDALRALFNKYTK